MERACLQLQAIHSSDPKWMMHKQHLAQYSEALAARVLNMCRCVSQGVLKNSSCPWVKNLPWIQRQALAASPAASPMASPPASSAQGTPQDAAKSSGSVAAVGSPSTCCLYGWDRINRTAWKAPEGMGGPVFVSQKVLVPEGAGPLDPVQALFGDGDTWAVPDVTVKEWRAQAEGDPEDHVYWMGTHVQSQHKIIVRDRCDRTALFSIFEQRRQAPRAA
eukprot:13883042-Alexandrium_andersonii.AAC.1